MSATFYVYVVYVSFCPQISDMESASFGPYPYKKFKLLDYTGVYKNYMHLATGLVFTYIYSLKIL